MLADNRLNAGHCFNFARRIGAPPCPDEKIWDEVMFRLEEASEMDESILELKAN
jgi:hypothetical protein